MRSFIALLLLTLITVPTFAISEQYHFYAYAGGDPINRWDPSGLDWKWVNGKWERINGTKWVKPPLPGILPEHLGGKDTYNIIDHIHVNNALNGMSQRGEPLTSYRLTQAVAAQQDLWNALPGSTQVTRINYAFGAWDRTMIRLEPHSGEGYLQGKIVDNLTSKSFATRLLGKVQRIGYNTLNTSRLFTFKGSDQRLGAYHAGAISAERNQELKVDEYISAGIDVALLLTTGGAGNVAATGTSRLLVWTGRSINAGFAGYSGAHAYDAARQGNYGEAGYHAAFAFLGGAGAVRSGVVSSSSARARAGGGPASGRPALPSGYHYRTVNGRSVVARNPGRAGDLPAMHLQGGRLVEGAASTARSTGGRWSWSNVRARLGESGWARPNQDVHHWLIPRNGWGRVVPDIVKNRKWNLMRMPSRTEHFHVHGWSFNGQPGYGLLNRLWRGTPLPAKLTIGGGLAAGGAAYYYGSE